MKIALVGAGACLWLLAGWYGGHRILKGFRDKGLTIDTGARLLAFVFIFAGLVELLVSFIVAPPRARGLGHFLERVFP